MKDWIDTEYERLKAIAEKKAQDKKFFETWKKTQEKKK